jgi:redox-regulated HSP33 family molecular chaperone
VKPEDLQKATAFGAADKACTHTVITSSTTRQEIKIECHRNGATQTGTVIVERPDNEHVKGTVRMSMEHGDRTMTANSTYESKWLGPTCSEQDK